MYLIAAENKNEIFNIGLLIETDEFLNKEFARNFVYRRCTHCRFLVPEDDNGWKVNPLVSRLQMLRQKNYLALGVLGCVLLLSATTADNSVHILSKYGHQPLTSTTLKWLPVAHYNPNESKEIVIGGVENLPDNEGDDTPGSSQCARCVARSLVQTERVCEQTEMSGARFDECRRVDGAVRIH